MTDSTSAAYDAFVSYASVDRRRARRIQRFLEAWISKTGGRRLRVFRDETDIRGGRLDAELAGAARKARTMIVCHSPAAAESRWVEEEVRVFRESSADDRVAIAIVAGSAAADVVGRTLVSGVEFRVHDLRRRGWTMFTGKLEMLRLLAFVADVDMRTLRNWHLRRVVARTLLTLVATLIPLALLLNLPVDRWQPLHVKLGQQDLPAVAAEVHDGKLKVVSRLRAQGPQGFRNKLQVVDDALSDKPTIRFDEVSFRRRVLPLSMLPHEQRGRVPAIDVAANTRRKPAAEAMAAELQPGDWIVVLPLALTDEELDAARDEQADFNKPIPRAKGSLVATRIKGETKVAEVESISPVWEPNEAAVGPTSPARAMPVAMAPGGDIWLGLEGKDARESGGLWLRRAGDKVWVRQPGFVSVNSIAIDTRIAGAPAVIVAERHLDVWQGIRLVTRPTRIRMQVSGGSEWRDHAAPPFGTRSEVDLVGELGKASLIRVDEKIFQHGDVPLWRFLTHRP